MDNHLNLYYIFYTAARHQNISLAAKELFISQPAVSKSISKLEESLDTKLFVRNSKGVRLTPDGELLYRQTEAAFHALKSGEEQLSRRKELGIGQLSIGVSNTLCKYVLLPYLKEFIKANPHIRISIECQSSFHTIDALKNGSVDIGLIGEPSANGIHTDISFYPVTEIQDGFVTTESYLENLKKRVLEKPEDSSKLLSHATLMLLDKDNLTRQYMDTYLNNYGFLDVQTIEVSSMDLLIDFVKIDLGIACVIEDFVKKELEDGTLRRFSMPFTIPKRKIGFACLKQTNPSSCVDEFIQFFQKEQFCFF